MFCRILQKSTLPPTSPHKPPLASNLANWISSSSEAAPSSDDPSSKSCYRSRQALEKKRFRQFSKSFFWGIDAHLSSTGHSQFLCHVVVHNFCVNHYAGLAYEKFWHAGLLIATAFRACRFPATQDTGVTFNDARSVRCKMDSGMLETMCPA